jgi:hypothetical protein
MSADTLLSRLEAVKQTGPGRWIARCPAHADKTPSLAIRELDDGRVLLHDFGGCSVESILDACDLTFDDLFPPRSLEHRGKPERRPFPALDVLRLIGKESLIVAASAKTLTQRALSGAEQSRVLESAMLIQGALNAAGIEVRWS